MRIKKILISLILSIAPLAAYTQDNIVSTKQYKLAFNPANGSLVSFFRNDREYISKVAASEPLFFIRLRNEKGQSKNLMAFDNKGFKLEKAKTEDGSFIVSLHYTAIGHLPVDAIVTVNCPKGSDFTFWNIEINNQTNEYIDFVDFPTVVVPNDLVGMNGDSRIFRPSMEGALIEDIEMRNNTWLAPKQLEYPSTGWAGYYPGSCSMQFMAYYNKPGGLYLAAHDKEHHLKGMEVYKHKVGGIVIKYRIYTGAAGKGLYKLPFDMVLGGFNGNWYDAADIYRQWVEQSNFLSVPKLKNNKYLPAWFDQSPVMLIYPVKGHQDAGDMHPNGYFPYTSALHYIDTLSKKTGSKVMALLMHWEGSAPWAPPYIWPPYGGEQKMHDFVKAMHEHGNLVGLYGSGMAFTLKSKIDTNYNRSKEFHDLHLRNVMNIAPDGELATNGMGTGVDEQDFRLGYDMCPSAQFTKNVMHSDFGKFISAGVDYVQLFNQNAGGGTYLCYSKHHGHPHAPGQWMATEMLKLYQALQAMAANAEHKTLIGAEGAAAEPFIPYLPLNESRFNFNYMQGKPVPAYAYVYHEYINNYMGNQAAVESGIDIQKSPMNLHQRIAYSFLAGDMLSLSLTEKTHVGWGWGTDPKTPAPNQHEILALVNNLNAWRRGIAKDFLIYGRMEKPLEIKASDMPVHTPSGRTTRFNSVFSTRWANHEGRKVQMIVNYTPKNQTVNLLSSPEIKLKKVKVWLHPGAEPQLLRAEADGSVIIEIEGLSAAMVEF